jgi:hypothetical protein
MDWARKDDFMIFVSQLHHLTLIVSQSLSKIKCSLLYHQSCRSFVLYALARRYAKPVPLQKNPKAIEPYSKGQFHHQQKSETAD